MGALSLKDLLLSLLEVHLLLLVGECSLHLSSLVAWHDVLGLNWLVLAIVSIG